VAFTSTSNDPAICLSLSASADNPMHADHFCARPRRSPGLADGQGCSSSWTQKSKEANLSKYTNTTRRDVYQSVTDQIIEELEKGVRPWLKP